MKRLFSSILVFFLLFGGSAYSLESDVGIVLMHGKWAKYPTSIVGLARILESKGYRVVTPTMAWSDSRSYDVGYEQTLKEIDSAVESLQKQGAKRIIVAGHSFGANAAIAYAGSRGTVDGVMALGPGHRPDSRKFQQTISGSLEKARQMFASGHGDDKAWFKDQNQGQIKSINTTALIYLSYFDPEGLASMPNSAAKFKTPIPLLMVVGRNDPVFEMGEDYIFNKAPKHPQSKYIVVESDHMNTPSASITPIVQWLSSLENRE